MEQDKDVWHTQHIHLFFGGEGGKRYCDAGAKIVSRAVTMFMPFLFITGDPSRCHRVITLSE